MKILFALAVLMLVILFTEGKLDASIIFMICSTHMLSKQLNFFSHFSKERFLHDIHFQRK